MLARSVALNIVGSAVSLTVGFVSSLLLARWLGPSDRGLLGILFSASQVGVAVAGLGLPVAIMYYASRRDARSGALLGNSLVFTALATVVFVPLFWLVREPVSDLLSHGRGGRLWVLAALLVPLTFLDWTTHNQLLGKLRFELYNVLVILSKVVTLVLVVFVTERAVPMPVVLLRFGPAVGVLEPPLLVELLLATP